MMRKLYYALFSTAFIFAFNTGFGQDVINIADGGSYSTPCSGSLTITDSDADNGNYEPNETYQVTLCVDAGSESNAHIVISPYLNGDTWDIDENSSLFVYDGPNASGTLLGEFNSVNTPTGITVQGSGSCLTLVFTSGSGSSGEGFTAHFSCYQPLQPFDFEVEGFPNYGPFGGLSHPSIKICFTDTISIHVNTNYPLSDAGGNGYEQNDSTSWFRYLMGDGTIYEGYGLTDVSHVYNDPFGYLVTIIITDINGRVESSQLYVLVSPRPNFSNLAVNDTLCIDQETDITGGIFNGDTLGISPSASAILGGGILGDQLYLPDGNNDLYETTITIDEFDDDQVIQSVSDIVSFCVNMEHSFLGDLEMGLTCPDGTEIIIFNSYNNSGNTTQMYPGGFGGGGVFLGDADDGYPDGVPGIGFDYCFSDDATTGTFAQIYNNPDYIVPVSEGSAIMAGTYLPEEGFENFIGCPINGDWTLKVKDNWSSDDGFIFNWSIYFDPTINPSTEYYSPDIDSVYWMPNPDIISNNGTTITVKPSQEGNNSFTFVAVDEFGCSHDTTVNVYVRPHMEFPGNIACDLTYLVQPTNSPAGGVYTVIDAPTSSADIDFIEMPFGPDSLKANEYGVYQVEYNENNCHYTDTATIDYRPVPSIEAFLDSTVLCIDESVVLDAGPQEANSDHFSIVWTQNGNAFNTSDYAVTVDETGVYQLVITGVCGTASDTTSIVAIQLSFEGDTVCGMQADGLVNLSPVGTGMWSANSADISFSSANQLATQISTSKYGSYDITFTDSRCPEDGVTHDFTFVEQPEATILPTYPEFCVDQDSLVLVANVNGSNSGTYIWGINGTSVPDNSNTLKFGPEYFEPLKDYLIDVMVIDAFGVCPPSVGEANFTGKWCEYNIPNVVSPDGDGKNDKFHVQFGGYFPGAHLRVYDRWGKLIFDQPDYDQYQGAEPNMNGWDPSEVKPGTYFYELLLPTVNKKETGYIEVIGKDG